MATVRGGKLKPSAPLAPLELLAPELLNRNEWNR